MVLSQRNIEPVEAERPTCEILREMTTRSPKSVTANAISTNKRPVRADAGITVGTESPKTPNGEVERPRTSAGSAPRAHTVFQRPRRTTTHASRPAPTIVRRTTLQVNAGVTIIVAENHFDQDCAHHQSQESNNDCDGEADREGDLTATEAKRDNHNVDAEHCRDGCKCCVRMAGRKMPRKDDPCKQAPS